MAKNLKRIHPDYVMLYKVGSFYHAYGKDSYIMADMFDYTIKYVKNIPSCGFPKATIARVQSELEKGKINYMLLDPRNNYDVDYKFDFKNDNKYDEKFEKSYVNVKDKQKLKEISERIAMYIGKDEFKELIRKIEDVLDEKREV